ncbi:uncharacterized protein LOC113574200 [Electrophorus electricus]|uniref:uncharacterized protein LOC113574200 n=1 Tax=Electrophorus electricus TaxID=8005 RepID=UPI000F0A2071|nr:uncharacterized protein LOC113574200 [Electrophorus electricus]
MLGESFIHVLKYRQEEPHLPDISRPSFNPPADNHYSSFPLTQEDIPASVQPTVTAVRHTLKQSRSKAPCAGPGLHSSICESHLSPRHSQDPGDLLERFGSTYLDLQPRSLSEIQVHPHSSTDCEPRQLQSIPAEQACVPDDGYLVMDSSIMLNGEPPTNSMLNGYLDRKLLEVYSQYLQERLVCLGSSLACSMLPPLPQASLLQLSQQMNLELSLEPGQGIPSQKVSSHFSSPVLRISNAEQPKYSRPSDYQ